MDALEFLLKESEALKTKFTQLYPPPYLDRSTNGSAYLALTEFIERLK